MTALERWQAQVRACRADRGESEEQTWQRLAQWHDNWARHNDYVTRVLPRLLTCLSSESRVLEIGPGSGAFTLPLARAVKQVVAVEPSSNMRHVLADKLDEAWLTNAQIIPLTIEEGRTALDGEFELAFASHSLYNVEPIDEVMRDLVRVARHTAILMGTGDTPAWQRDLYAQFWGKPRVPVASFREFYPMLMEQGIYADVEILPTSSNYVFESEDAMRDYWQRQLGLPDARRDELCAALARHAERRGDHLGIYSVNRSALMWIERERNLLSPGADTPR